MAKKKLLFESVKFSILFDSSCVLSEETKPNNVTAKTAITIVLICSLLIFLTFVGAKVILSCTVI